MAKWNLNLKASYKIFHLAIHLGLMRLPDSLKKQKSSAGIGRRWVCGSAKIYLRLILVVCGAES
jgi:hypothetical protein